MLGFCAHHDPLDHARSFPFRELFVNRRLGSDGISSDQWRPAESYRMGHRMISGHELSHEISLISITCLGQALEQVPHPLQWSRSTLLIRSTGSKETIPSGQKKKQL